jgi:hypothetical protein
MGFPDLPGDYARQLCQAIMPGDYAGLFWPGQMALINGLTIGQIHLQVKVFPNPAILLGKIKFDFSQMGVILHITIILHLAKPKPS